MSKQIPLTQGKFAIVDDEDYDWLMQWKWQVKIKKGGTAYAYRGVSKFGKKSKIYMHRIIINTPDGSLTDHIDMNGLNNTRSNLRVATKSCNCMNRTRTIRNTSGYKGVYLGDNGLNRWRSQIKTDSGILHLGYYRTKEDAARAYNEAALKYHGDFARLNVIPD